MLEKYIFPYIRKWCMVGGLCLAFPWVAFAQQQKISLNIQNVTLKQAMEQIKEQASVNVAYSKEFVDPNKPVSLKVDDVTLQTALTQLFEGTNIGFRFLDNSVLLYNREKQEGSEKAIRGQQNITVSGTVVEVNDKLEDTPELINQDAYANWIIKVELSDKGELDNLMDAKAYEEFCNK